MKKTLHTLLFNKYVYVIVFILGALVFLYPLVGNIYNASTQTHVISHYEEEIGVLSEAEIAEIQSKALEYNRALTQREGSPTDELSAEELAAMSTVYMGVIETGEAIGSLEIPKIEVKLPIYRGTSDAVLGRGVGLLENTSLPLGGVSTHSVLVGHRGLPSARLFRDLDKLEEGDVFIIDSLGETLAYEVESISIVAPDDIDGLRIRVGEDLCTLVTCDPYMVNNHRMLVTGHRTEYVPAELDPSDKISFVDKYLEYFVIVGFFLLLALIIWLLRRLITRRQRRDPQNE